MIEQPELPSTFYRVTTRALIFDDDQRLIVVQDAKGGWQLPGGGWEHDEQFEDCLRREVREELGVDVQEVSPIVCVYTAPSSRGHIILRMAARTIVSSYDFLPGDDMVAWKAVNREEFMAMTFISAEGPVQEFADQIWSVSA